MSWLCSNHLLQSKKNPTISFFLLPSHYADMTRTQHDNQFSVDSICMRVHAGSRSCVGIMCPCFSFVRHAPAAFVFLADKLIIPPSREP